MYVYINPRYRYFGSGVSAVYPANQPELTNCRRVTPPCSYETRDVTPTRLERILPYYLGTRNAWATTQFARDIQNDLPGARFYGCLHDPADPPPTAQHYSLPDMVEGGHMKRKDFERAKRDGKIVVQRRIKAEVSCLVRPGFDVTGLPSPNSVSFKRNVQGALSRVASCNGTMGVPLSDDSTRVMGTGFSAIVEDNNYVLLDRYSYTPGQGRWYLPTPRLAGNLMEFVRSKALAIPPNEEVVTRALADANNRYWDVLTELAELPELIKYILGVLKDILKLCKIAKWERDKISLYGRLDAGEKLSWQLAQWWLEFRYAVMPLMYSVGDALQYLAAAERVYISTRKSGTSELAGFEADGWVSNDILSSLDRCFIKRRFGNAADSVFLTLNPLTTAWEKVTLSFVVDWVFNVGDLVTSLVSPSGVTQEAATASSQVSNAVVTFENPMFRGASISVTVSVYHLEPITPLGHIGLTLRPNMTWQRWIDALSLLWLGIKQDYLREVRRPPKV